MNKEKNDMNTSYAPLPLSIKVNDEFYEMHHHYDLEIVYVMCGSATLLVSNTTYDINAGDMRIINIDNFHRITPKSNDFKYVSLFLDMPFFNQFIPNIEFVFFECVPNTHLGGELDNYLELIRTYFWNIVKHCFSNHEHDKALSRNDYAVNQALLLLTELRNWFTMMDQFIDNKEKDSQRLWLIMDYIYDNYNRKLPLSEVADYVFLTPNYLSHYIKKVTKCSYQEVVNFIRSEIALQMLIETDNSISRISNECGFSEPKYFEKYFKMFYGISPRDYRKEYGFDKLTDRSDYKSINIDTLSMDTLPEKEQDLIIRHINRYAESTEAPAQDRRALSIFVSASLDTENAAQPPDVTTAKRKPLCLHISKATHLYSPGEQSIINRAVRDLGISFLYIENNRNLPTEEWSAIDAISESLGCKAERKIARDKKHIALYSDPRSNAKALFTSDLIKTPQYYLYRLYSMMSDDILDSGDSHIITGNADNLEILLVNDSDSDMEISTSINHLIRKTYARITFTLDLNDSPDKSGELSEVKQFLSRKQLQSLSDINGPDVSYKLIDMSSRKYTATVSMAPYSAVFILLNSGRQQTP